ncbi:hypothetical protein AMTR_s00030p00197350 [Amborella trichopoda]|uniref:RuvB-like helicase n=1 Tax=Amborella trichopoda TaxID=13333 RepID=U5D1L8_AMBTC|nr:hypothetical protein AMTR_s00030p00197350 [Amborella trichopoda]
MVGSEVYSSEVKKKDVLRKNFRRAIDLCNRENKDVYEGEARTKQLKLDLTLYDALIKKKVAVGDIIHIEANSGAVKRVGRSDAFATEFDLDAEEYVSLPTGEVHKKKEIVHVCTFINLCMKAFSNFHDLLIVSTDFSVFSGCNLLIYIVYRV